MLTLQCNTASFTDIMYNIRCKGAETRIPWLRCNAVATSCIGGVLYKRHFFDEAVFSYQEAGLPG